MAEDRGKPEPAFKVQDRRRFTETGEARSEQEEPAKEKVDEPPPPPAEAARFEEPLAAEAPREALEINFATFVISLCTQALAHLGEMPNPVDGTTHVELDAARQIIDIIAMLREKTRGNLDEAESALLEDALYDLRMRYVERAHGR
jgi:hypothetical protein